MVVQTVLKMKKPPKTVRHIVDYKYFYDYNCLSCLERDVNTEDNDFVAHFNKKVNY